MLETDYCAWIAELDVDSPARPCPVGFSIANAIEKAIFGVFVLPNSENLGAGRALMCAAEQWLWSRGIDEIWLLTCQGPHVTSLWILLSFRVDAHRSRSQWLLRWRSSFCQTSASC